MAMILCICKVVSDKEVKAAVQLGAHSVEGVGQLTGAGTDCGCCQGAIEDLLAGVARVGPACGGNCAECPRATAAQGSATAA